VLFSRLNLLLMTVVFLIGCGSSTDRVPVSGVASYDGEPIENGTVELIPTDGTSGPATGSVIRGGRWEIAADKGPMSGGTYLVRITGVRKTGRKFVDRDRPNQTFDVFSNYIPVGYNAQSTLKITISPDSRQNSIDFVLEKKPEQ